MSHSPLEILTYQLLRFANPRESYFFGYLAAGFLLASGVYLWRWRRRSRLPVRALLRVWGSRRVLLHPSSAVDYKLYLLNGLLMVTVYGGLQLSNGLWRSGTLGLLHRLAPEGLIALPKPAAMAVTTVLMLLATELAYWALHYAFHRIPALWRIHAVHHSAEVMTPATEWRQHPIEFLAFGNALPLAIGVSSGLTTWLFGASGQPFTLLQINVLLIVHFLTIHHLRHTSLWISARGWLGRLVHSPAHHQIHHSADPRHFDKNMGYALSVWDWAFGTLYVPERRERLVLGVAEGAHTGLLDSLLRPFGVVRFSRTAQRADRAPFLPLTLSLSKGEGPHRPWARPRPLTLR